MTTSTAILQVAMILIAARVLGETAAWSGIPPVIGEIAAGILLGPSLLGIIEPAGLIRVLAEIGIILLLFQVGLETDLGELADSGVSSVIVAVSGFLLPFVSCFLLCRLAFDLDPLPSMMVAGTMTATSIGITMRTFNDLGKGQSREGRIVLGAVVIDDILGVLLLAILFNFVTHGAIDYAGTWKILLFMTAFFLVAPAIAKTISHLVRHWESRSAIPGMVPTTIVSLVLSMAWLSHELGIPELLGGFATGLALSRRFFLPFGAMLKAQPEFSSHVHEQMKPVIHLFTPIFFAEVGLSLDLSSLDWGSTYLWVFSICLAAVAILTKILGALTLRESLARRLIVGISMVPRGEVGLIFAELGRQSGIFDAPTFAIVVLVIAYTTLFTPFWMRLFYRRFGHLVEY